MNDPAVDDEAPAPTTNPEPDWPDDEGDGDAETLSVADPVLAKSRRLSRQCPTCIFSPGNPMHLEPGALKDIVDSAIAQGSYVVCHETLPGMAPPRFAPAICRGFHDRYTTGALQVIARLWGFVDVDSPAATALTAGADAAASGEPSER